MIEFLSLLIILVTFVHGAVVAWLLAFRRADYVRLEKPVRPSPLAIATNPARDAVLIDR
ncbi:hypothetical protein ACYOEI_10910 [Singulisphaera rosea]